MAKDRIKITATLEEIFQKLNFILQKKSTDHAGEKWILRYASQIQGMGSLAIDLNFLLRVPLWPIQHLDSFHLGAYKIRNIPVLDKHEIAGGKLRALFSRQSSRDLFDAHQILNSGAFDIARVRTAFIVYGAMSRTDWRAISPKDIRYHFREFQNMLTPMLKKSTIYQAKGWAERLLVECREAIPLLLPFNALEENFLNHFLSTGEIIPTLLVQDPQLADRIAQQPRLHWKSMHIKQYQSKRSLENKDTT